MLVTNDFDNIYLHDSTVTQCIIDSGVIVLYLSSAEIFESHKDNLQGRDIYAIDCRLNFIGVNYSMLKIWDDDTDAWLIQENPDCSMVIRDIIEHTTIGENEYLISGMTLDSSWAEWTLRCERLELKWTTESDSVLTEENF